MKNSLSGFSLIRHLYGDMIAIKAMQLATPNDAELVNGTLAGKRDAFSQIVSRYQSLVCSLTYSATGIDAGIG